jgi:hypothetical protein
MGSKKTCIFVMAAETSALVFSELPRIFKIAVVTTPVCAASFYFNKTGRPM